MLKQFDACSEDLESEKKQCLELKLRCVNGIGV